MANAGFMLKEALNKKTFRRFDPIPPQMILCAENAIRIAWQALVSNQMDWGIVMRDAKENALSYGLVDVINLFCQEGKRPTQEFVDFVEYFESVNMESGYQDYTGSTINQPDFALKPRNNPYSGLGAGYYAIFVEAKIIDGTGEKTSKYFTGGARRFLNGNYAWAMPHGLMLGYVRTEQDAHTAISKYFEGHGCAERSNLKQLPAYAKPPDRNPRICVTLHGRNWSYVDRQGVPGDIVIRHLWLRAY